MNIKRKSERGQALILIALAVVGLLGLTALAVDGGHVYAQRRQAQNAADTAAFAAAIAKIQGGDENAMITAGRARATSNGFQNGSNATVDINNSPIPPAPPAYIGNPEYVQAIITADVPTFFARIVGVASIPIHVQAVAKAIPPHDERLGGENGLVALGDVCNAVRTHGGGTTTLEGGGVFSNSSFNGNPTACYAFNGMGTGDQIRLPSADVVGCVDPGDVGSQIVFDGGALPNCGATSIHYPPPPLNLGVTCADLPIGTKTGTTVHQGRWSHALGNLGGNNAFPPNGVDKIEEGVYCVDGNFIIGASDSITSVKKSDGTPGGQVTFILDGSLKWNAAANIDLTPIQDDALRIHGLLVYRPLNNPLTGLCDGGGNPPCQVLEFNGGTNSKWSGTVYAPDSECDVNGTSDSLTLNAQAICYSIDIGGDSTWILTYDASVNGPLPFPGETELNR